MTDTPTQTQTRRHVNGVLNLIAGVVVLVAVTVIALAFTVKGLSDGINETTGLVKESKKVIDAATGEEASNAQKGIVLVLAQGDCYTSSLIEFPELTPEDRAEYVLNCAGDRLSALAPVTKNPTTKKGN